MDLNTFKKQYTNHNSALAIFMRISALSWLEYAQKASGGRFTPDIDRIMMFSDADEDYNFDYGKEHTSINPNVTVGELLRVANKLLSISFDFDPSEFWDDYEPDDYDPEDETEDSDPDDEPKPDPQDDGMYIVNCLMVYPFTMREDAV